MKKNANCLVVIFFCLGVFVKTQAQSIPELPKLTPSYSEDFSNLSTYSSICFGDAFIDKNGRFWLQVCDPTRGTTSFHLFQFDGYQFNLVQGALADLGVKDKVYDIYKNKELVGIMTKEEQDQIFFFDLSTHQLTTFPINEPGALRWLTVSEEEQLFLIHEEKDLLTFSEWKNGALFQQSTVQKNIISDSNTPNSSVNILFQNANSFWGILPLEDLLFLYDIRSGTVKKYKLKTLRDKIPKSKFNVYNLGDAPEIKVHESAGGFFLSIQYSDGGSFFKWEEESDELKPIDGFPSFDRAINIYKDQKNNFLFLYRNKKDEYQAVLQDESGKQFDYSDFFKDTNIGTITKLLSQDFKLDLKICSTRGISIHAVKASEAIHHFLSNDLSIRAMTELEDERFLVNAYERTFIVDAKNNIEQEYKDLDCGIGWTKIYKTNSGDIWSFRYSELVKYDSKLETCTIYPIPSDYIRLFTFIDKDEVAIVDRLERLLIYNLKTKEAQFLLENGEPKIFPGFVNDILYDENNLLWLATTAGLWKVNMDTFKEELIEKQTSFENARFLCIHEDEKGRLWLGTTLYGVYIYDPVSGVVKNLSNKEGLSNNIVASIIADDEGDRWIGTYNGISLVSQEGGVITNLFLEDGLVDRENNRYASLKARNGNILIGTVNGFNYINPQKIKERLHKGKGLKIYLTSLSYYNESTGQDTLVKNYFDDLDFIQLPASKRFLYLSFALSNYSRSKENQYAYKLEGIDEDWVSIGTQNTLNLNSLPSGKYRILIKGNDRFGNETINPIAIKIHAKEFFYKEIWFYILCLFSIACIGILWITRLRSMVKKATKEIEEDKAIIEAQTKKLKELDKAKSRFFTNISHEFRTPLTIISGMLEQIKSKPDIWLEKGVQMIKHNTLNLLDLINQILDLRKLESNSLQLNLVQGNIISYLNYIIESYQVFAKGNGVKIHFMPDVEEVKMDYDPDKILRIISNLLSNAVKFTPKDGDVYVQVSIKRNNKDDGNTLLIRIKDTGVGIPQDELPQIFDRFYQVDDSITRKGEGTGIGLALTQELVKLMKGKIEVSSEINKGSIFLIKLPINNASPMIEAFPDPSAIRKEIPHGTFETDLIFTSGNKEENNSLPSLLIVEDNPDVVQFLIASLEDNYQLQIARNGQEGIDKAIDAVPDLIISDVMMPEKDGYELCDTLKRDERTSHVPIILLTAKADVEAKISGLEKGADAYLTKPFNQKELLVRLEKLFELRQKLQARYQSIKTDEKVSDTEDVFIQKVRQAIEKNIDDADFGIAQLCRAIGLQRAQLHNKLKALTGLSTSIYIRSIRLKKAKHLLETTDLNVSEVAYDVGFKDPKYFSRLYIEAFNEPPSQTRK